MSKQISIGASEPLVDFTDVFTPTGYTVSYIKRRGKNSGMMMDGSYTDDVLAVKAVVTCYCMPTNEVQLQALLEMISNTYVIVRFFDPRVNAYRKMTAMPSEPVQKYRGQGGNALEYWTGTVITFTEK